ncbi:phosphate/phosphite/phosphonate ABC transporter substrate-binding protein [Candidatus Albibeggiatoa sp. nov. BB20]|uniref:phosphate/phosphite/phosphonate ABC transporter substrate-binding protein n=1 Tax=Candidatus Albibeggiatoa sp. nov. BB20 TaxID=3162723 RepID=UPI0033657467
MRNLVLSIFLLFSSIIIFPTLAQATDTSVCRFGIPPFQKAISFNEERKKYLPLLNWLTEQTGCKFVPVGAFSYEDLIKKITLGTVHVAELGAVSYIQAKNKNPKINMIATALTWNESKTELIDSYRSLVITLKKYKDINHLQDLQDKSIGFVNETSSSGFVYPAILIKKNEHIDYEVFFSKTLFLGSHPNVTGALANDSIVAGVTSNKNLEEAQRIYGDIFKVLWKSPPIPNVLFASHPSLPINIRQKLEELLPQTKVELFEGIGLIKGFVIRPDDFYDVTRKILAYEHAEVD